VTTTIDSTALFFGAPASLTVGGVEVGATLTAPKAMVEATQYAPDFQGAGGPISGAVFNTKIKASVEFDVNEITAAKLAWSMPGSASVSTQAVGVLKAGLATTLDDDPALGATIFDLISVTTINIGDFVMLGPTGSLTEANSEVMRVVTVGTAGGGDTVLENSAGGGALLDHGSGQNVVTCTGMLLDAPAAVGATNIKVSSVTGLVPGDFIRIGYVGHYEIRELLTVGTALAAGTGLTFVTPLTLDHALDEWVIEVAALGTTTTTWSIGRVDSSVFKTVVLDGLGVDGAHLIVTVTGALSDGKLDVEMSDSAVVGQHVVMTGYYAGATPAAAPFQIEVG